MQVLGPLVSTFLVWTLPLSCGCSGEITLLVLKKILLRFSLNSLSWALLCFKWQEDQEWKLMMKSCLPHTLAAPRTPEARSLAAPQKAYYSARHDPAPVLGLSTDVSSAGTGGVWASFISRVFSTYCLWVQDFTHKKSGCWCAALQPIAGIRRVYPEKRISSHLLVCSAAPWVPDLQTNIKACVIWKHFPSVLFP